MLAPAQTAMNDAHSFKTVAGTHHPQPHPQQMHSGETTILTRRGPKATRLSAIQQALAREFPRVRIAPIVEVPVQSYRVTGLHST
ncbi:protein of unknown function [Pararobbsia alpina]